ncbi:hypothetical protein L21SP2_1382 [Salinispira pacifica]|uniref:Uncharacterized protein n=1 Tax=Salinispira pacifica TaxID=1307761 RepID=V5WHY6_9SPIO|nr:hypothetical protein L21SP2_1382 [Salinispira pacifica]
MPFFCNLDRAAGQPGRERGCQSGRYSRVIPGQVSVVK